MRFYTSATLPPDIPSERILGIEVTDEATRARCGAGNAVGAGRRPVVALDAIGDHLIEIDTVVTTTPTLDTVAAMARLLLRRLNLWPDFSGADLDYPAAEQRCDDIARATLWRPDREWRPRPLPTVEHPWRLDEGHEPIEARRSLAHVDAIARGKVKAMFQVREHGPDVTAIEAPSLAHRVAVIACWLLWGDPVTSLPWGEADAVFAACGLMVGGLPVDDPRRALTLARTMVDTARAQLVADAWAGGLELVVADERGHHGCDAGGTGKPATAALVQRERVSAARRRQLAEVWGSWPAARECLGLSEEPSEPRLDDDIAPVLAVVERAAWRGVLASVGPLLEELRALRDKKREREAAVAEEREACARLCEEAAERGWSDGRYLASAIRERGSK